MNRFLKAAARAALLLAAPAAQAQEIPIPDYTLYNQARIGTLITQGVIDRAAGRAGRPTTPASTNIAGSGLRENDAGDALAAFFVAGWQVVAGSGAPLGYSAGAVRGVRAQVLPLVGQSLTAHPAAAGENFKLQTVLLSVGAGGTRQKNTLPAFRQKVAALFRTRYGLELTQYNLSERGFVKK